MNDHPVLRIDHVSIAVRDYDKAHRFFSTLLGAVPGAAAEDPVTKYFWQIFSIGDLSRLELIKSTGPGSFLDNFLADREGGVHHITIQTRDIEETKRLLEAKGIPYFGYNEYIGVLWKELFIHPRHAFGVLVQIAEFRAEEWLGEAVRIPGGKRWQATPGPGGVELSLSHPGGGQVRLNLKKEEVRSLITELEGCLG